MSSQEIPKELEEKLKKSGFQFASEMPPYVASLMQLPSFFRYLDKRYGTPDLKNPKKKKGEYALRLILKYLAEHKCSTCEEIAQFEYDKNISTKRKLKSITDDIRKFLHHNLIPSQLVLFDQPKKKSNRSVKTYSLSPIGILYCLYLFGNFRTSNEIEMTVYDVDELESATLKNISKEYSSMLPKVFGRFDRFEKIFGKDFLSIVIDLFIAIYDTEIVGIPAKQFLLKNYVLSTFDYINARKFREPQQLIAEQISLIFYINLEESIENYLSSKEWRLEVEKTMNMEPKKVDQYNKKRKKTSTARYLKRLEDAKKLWIKIMDEDKELKKWYTDFIKQVADIKKREHYGMSGYKKEMFVPLNFKNRAR